MKPIRLGICLLAFLIVAPLAAQQLEIHYIDVGWGGSVFVKGPNGTTVLLEAGDTGRGTTYVVPYLKSIGIQPANGLDYMVGGHQHCDHIGGLDEVIQAGYNVRNKNYYNGSSYTGGCVDGYNAAGATTTAGAPVPMPVGTVIQLGNGATMTCIARNGQIIGGGSVPVTDENDRSIALLIKYGGFDYIWASDMGGGPDSCVGRGTSQLDVESAVIQAISPGGANPLISAGGIDVMHVNHHGSESSSNPTYFSMAKPAVAVIGVGDGQGSNFELPRTLVVDQVLLGASSSCVTAPPAFVIQSEEGSPAGPRTSHSGFCVGNIKITTDGVNLFTVSADGAVHQGPNELVASGLPRSFTLDDSPGADHTAPTVSITAPASGATVSGTVNVTANASDSGSGMARVDFYLDNVLTSSDTTAPYAWSWNASAVTGSHTLGAKAFDNAGNSAPATNVTVTVTAPADTTAPTVSITAPANGASVTGTVNVTANASDSGSGMARVDFLLDGAVTSSDNAAPYAWSWNSASTTPGSHTLSARAYDVAGNSAPASNVVVTVVAPDTTAPTVSITAPVNGAAVSGTVSVTASASDTGSGVARVEFYLDSVLTNTDTTSPYSWSWDTTTATAGAHTLSAKAYDVAGNSAPSTNVSVTIGAPADISGWTLTQANSTYNYVFPANTKIPSKGYLIIARNSTKSAFQTFWGVTLPANVVFINSADSMPQINGSETFSLYNASGTKVDGTTVAMDTSGGSTLQRKTCGTASLAGTWNRLSWSSANPGSGGMNGCGKGAFINEFSDAVGTGNYVYEFVEIYNDK